MKKPSEIIMEKAKIQASKTFDVISDIILVPYVVNQILDFLDEQAEEKNKKPKFSPKEAAEYIVENYGDTLNKLGSE